MTRWWFFAVVGLVLLVLAMAAGESRVAADGFAARPEPVPPGVPPVQRAVHAPTAPLTSTTTPDWIRLGSEAARHWRLGAMPDDGARAIIEPRELTPERPSPYRILLLYTKPSSAYDTALSTILTIFHDKQIGAVFTAINVQDDPRGEPALQLIRARQFDLVFTMGSDATALAHDRLRGESTPVVTVSSKDPVLLGQVADYGQGSGTNIAYTSLNMPMEAQIAYLKELNPALQNVAVLYAASNRSARQTQVEPLKKVAAANGLLVHDVVVEDDTRAASELARRMPVAIEAMRQTDPELRRSIFWITGSTSVFDQIATIARVAGKIPVLSMVPDIVQEGDASAVLSIGVSFESNAHLAALYAVAIMTNTSHVGDLPVGLVSPPDIAINFRRARAIGLKIPFRFFESASVIYDHQGTRVRGDQQE